MAILVKVFMKRKYLKSILRNEVEKYLRIEYSTLQDLLFPLHYFICVDNTNYQIQVVLLDKTSKYIQISVEIDDDTSLLNSIFPVNETIVIHKNNRPA